MTCQVDLKSPTRANMETLLIKHFKRISYISSDKTKVPPNRVWSKIENGQPQRYTVITQQSR